MDFTVLAEALRCLVLDQFFLEVKGETVKASSLISVLCAAHYTYLVEAPWKERGGLFLVAPPGHVKSTFLSYLSEYPSVYYTTDLNTQMLGSLRDEIAGGKIRSIVIPDIQKLYERHPTVASGVEGALRAMMEEGFVSTSYQDAHGVLLKARCLLVSAMVPSFYERHRGSWQQSGMLRRVLVSQYVLNDPQLLMKAVHVWKRLEVRNGLKFGMPQETIPYSLTDGESILLRKMLGRQDDVTPFALLKKIACVLRWRFRRMRVRDETMSIITDFGESLFGHGEGAEVKL